MEQNVACEQDFLSGFRVSGEAGEGNGLVTRAFAARAIPKQERACSQAELNDATVTI